MKLAAAYVLSFLGFSFIFMSWPFLVISYGELLYDYTAYTECKAVPEEPLYNGGILKEDQTPKFTERHSNVYAPALILHNLTQSTLYSFSIWVKIEGAADSASITATLTTDHNTTFNCIGNVLARNGCWSFLKGGFMLESPSTLSIIFLQLRQNSGDKSIYVDIASASLQPFTHDQWRTNQQRIIDSDRKREVTVHVSNTRGDRLRGANITVQQIARDFPFGSAIASTILGNAPYQKWFVERFNAAVFENELKWYATEPEQGKLNYTLADQMLYFVRSNKISTRGHNIFWEDPKYTPQWVRDLNDTALRSAVNSRIRSLMSKYREEFIHWDVSNEMLHFDFYEQRLGPNATAGFYKTAHKSDPLATLFLNEFNVVETCSDMDSTVNMYISKIQELELEGASMDGVGLESHFTVPNLPLMRAILDKLATLGLPIWLTEVDISNKFDQKTQAIYLEQVLREGFSHPSVDGIMLWTALHQKGCYQMCLTDINLQNLPAGDAVDKLLTEWQTPELNGVADSHGSYNFSGFLGEYRITVQYHNRTANSTFSLSQGHETKHFNIQL